MVKNDAEITEFVIKNCNFNFSEEFIKKLGSNSQSSRLLTKYELIQKALEENYKKNGIKYTTEQINVNASKAYIYAKMVSGKFLDIRPRVDSTKTLNYIIENYEDGYKYMLEAIFMKLGTNGIASYVKGKIEGTTFFTKITGVTNSQPSEMKKNSAINISQINKIKNLIFEIRAKEDENRWIDSRIQRDKTQKNKIQNNSNQYKLNYAQ